MPRKPASKGSDKQVSLFQTPEPPDLLRKAVRAIHIAPKSGKIGLQQRKMFSSLIKNALRQEAFEVRPDELLDFACVAFARVG